ncbi:MAG TPA: HAD family phosphatase, partial [Patescibacteria group bacterium]|nr:HAD family phosphatase [Patescibacteria group bacterium]
MITTIIFDLGGVLFTNGTKRLISFVSEEYGIDKEKVKEVMDGEIGKKYREAKIDRHIFWNHFLTELGISANSDFLEEKWIFGYELIEETKEIIDDLRQKYKVYFLSDNVRNRVDKIHERYGFLDWFEGGIFSHEVGLKKPHPQLYKMILEKAGVNADEAVFVDDKEECLPPAKEIGMTAILFENPK